MSTAARWRNRARLTLEVGAVRAAIGPELRHRLPLADLVPYCLMLEAGVNAIEVSGGTHYSDPRFFCSRLVGTVPKEQEIYFKQAAELYRRSVKTPLLLVGGVRTLSRAAGHRVGLADFVFMLRPLVREPNPHQAAARGNIHVHFVQLLCFGPVRDAKGLYCVDLANKRQKTP